MQKLSELTFFQKLAGRVAVSDLAKHLVLLCAVRQAIEIALQLGEKRWDQRYACLSRN